MAKIITTIGACSTKKKAIGLQFIIGNGESELGGSYLVSGESAVVSSDPLVGTPVIGASFARTGCKYCGNKAVFRCGSCGRFICYDGHAARNFACPACGSVANVPATTGKTIVSSDARGGVRSHTETVKLRQGQEVKLQFSDKQLTKIIVGVGWEPSRTAYTMDVDSSVVLLGNGGLNDVIYFGNLTHDSGCIIHHGDNLTGEVKSRNSDKENITVYLDKVPQNINKLVFVLNIYNCRDKGQTLADVDGMYIKLYDPDTRNVLVEYEYEQRFRRDTAIIIGMAYRSGDVWTFKAIGDGSNADSISTLSQEVASRY